MPCKKFLSIRFEPGEKPRVYVDQNKNFITPAGMEKFTVAADLPKNTSKGATLALDAYRWPPEVYNSPITFSLGAQWPFGKEHVEEDDAVGGSAGRSAKSIEFTYDQAKKTLSWTQDGAGKYEGLVEFNDQNKVWYLILKLDPKSTNAAGDVLVDGRSVTA